MLITSSIPNLINGISQQPPTLRLASQAEGQVNFLSSVADGLVFRPPTRHKAKIDNVPWTDAFIHSINRDRVERYIVAIRNGVIRVFEATTGVERTVNAPNGWGYLSGGNSQSYRAVTVADFTFILNRNRVTRMSSTLSPARPRQSMVIVRAGNYGKTYTIHLNGHLRASYTTPDGSTASHINSVSSVHIAGQLINQLNAAGLGQYGYSFTQAEGTIIIYQSNANVEPIRVDDGAGGVGIIAIQDIVQLFSDLPSQAHNGYMVEVAGDQSSNFDNYHVKFATTGGGSFGPGVWKEGIKGGEEFRFDPTTMPHVLIREANGTFTFRQSTWADRKVGDRNKISHPSFVDRAVRDIFFFQNRLGFIADENVIMTQDGEFFDFWRGTATTLLDTDPVDLAVTSERVSLVNFAVPFNKSLLLFSDQTQFVLEGGDIFTAKTASISQSTSFESDLGVRPVGVGQYIYFPVPRGNHTAIREYFVQQGNEQNDALDVTSHVPRYIPRGLFKLAASSAEDTMIALSSQTPNKMWVYRFFFNDEGKLQSAWSQWEFSTEDTILNGDFIESTVFVLVTRADGTYLESLGLESGSVDEGSDVMFRVDRGVYTDNLQATFNGTNTTFTLPYSTNETLWVVARGSDTRPEGSNIPYEKPSGNTVRLRGDWRGAKLVIGQKYTARYTFSPFYLRQSEQAGGVSANADGRLQVRYLSIDYAQAAAFRVVSHPRGRAPSSKVFTGQVLGVASGTVGAYNLATGRFRTAIMCRNIDADIYIETDSFLPCAFTSAEWEATFNSRARKF